MIQVPEAAMTHGGKFHADDVFCGALLRVVNPAIRFVRVFQVPADYTGLVFDLGWGPFDHHQREGEIRPNGIPYAAFGLLWRELGESLVGSREEAERFDEKFIQPLDLDDNTGCGNVLASVLGNFNPSWDSDQDPDACYEEAVAFATVILQKRLDSIRSIGRAKVLVNKCLGQMENGVVVLDRFCPWRMFLSGTKAEFVVYPSQRGGYSAQGVPVSSDSNQLKISFPESWAGRPAQELPALSGIATLRFCHNNRFLVATGTQEDAIKACRIAQQAFRKS